MPIPQKRQRPFGQQHNHRQNPQSTSTAGSTTVQIPPQAYVVAYEAQLVHNADLAREVSSRNSRRGLGVIKYAGEVEVEDGADAFVDDGVMMPAPEVWADRYDIVHLLPSVTVSHSSYPTSKLGESSRSSSYRSASAATKASVLGPLSAPASPATSSTSWDSIPSDMEETFHLTNPEELEAYEISKKRKWMEALRLDRLKEREKEDKLAEAAQTGKKGWKEEENPPAAVLATMQHTAVALSSSPNPSVLELRILTNHTNDSRFEFLRGRYKTTWEKLKREARAEKDAARREEERKKGLGGLMGYDSSDSNEEVDDEDGIGPPPSLSPPPPPPDEADGVSPPPPPPLPPPPEPVPIHSPPLPLMPSIETSRDDTAVPELVSGLTDDEEEKKRLRRLRADEWKRKRAAGGS